MVEFKRLARIPILDVCKWLAIPLKTRDKKTWRGTCPLCQSERTFVASNIRNKFFCHSCKRKGDCIQLVAEIRNVSVLQAAKELAAHFKPP